MSLKDHYHPLYVEELFIITLYGTDEEVERFNELMAHKDDEFATIQIVALIEDIKRRHLTRMNWYCCHRCENYKLCRINWYRGEKNLERNCCTYCSHYETCYSKFKNSRKQ